MDQPTSPVDELVGDELDLGDDARKIVCPICRRGVSPIELLSSNVLSESVVSIVGANNPSWRVQQGICRRCAERFGEAHERLRRAYPGFGHREYKILPTAMRLGASAQYTGRGVTVAFLDSGFYGHPDLVEPKNRILKYVDITNPRAKDSALYEPNVSSWHGMMTSVVACGNGHLSNGLYRGIASDANLVLVKVGEARRILHDDIRRGIEWVVRNREKFNIRIVNISCGGDYEASYLDDALSQAVERATRDGILVCAAVGNAGRDNDHAVLPPASSPSVLTVGGIDDKNRLEFADYDMYHSSYGPTIDGLQKPEVVAPGIWVAAPILPGTPTADQAEFYSALAGSTDATLREVIAAHHGVDEDFDAALGLDNYLIRHLVEIKLRDHAVISGSYKHVDGTSFSSPIVASIAAQIIEANPSLRPQQIKSTLVRTATRMPHVPVDRQGWGVVNPKRAVLRALRTEAYTTPVIED